LCLSVGRFDHDGAGFDMPRFAADVVAAMGK
jgi:hypothetical protein